MLLRNLNVLALAFVLSSSSAQGQDFVRGDLDASGTVALPDIVSSFLPLLLESTDSLPPPFDRADVNDNESVNWTDFALLLDALYTPDDPALRIVAPFPLAGPDPSDAMGDLASPAAGYEVRFVEVVGGSASSVWEIRVTSPLPVLSVEFGLDLAPGVTPPPTGAFSLSVSAPATIVERGTAPVFRLTIGDGQTPPQPVLPAGGDQLVGILQFDAPPESATPFSFVTDFGTAAVPRRATVATMDFEDHLPFVQIVPAADPGVTFTRGLCAPGSTTPSFADAMFALNFIFTAGPFPGCQDSCDFNDDGIVSFADPLSLIAFLYTGGSPPAPPFDGCGSDPTPDELDCAVPPSVCPQ